MKHLFFLFICLTFYCQIASAQNGSEIWYALPLYQSDDPTGKFVSHIIDAELTKFRPPDLTLKHCCSNDNDILQHPLVFLENYLS